MVAVAMREVAVLVLVFGMLDKLVAGVPSVGWTASVAVLFLALFWVGGTIEQRRRGR